MRAPRGQGRRCPGEGCEWRAEQWNAGDESEHWAVTCYSPDGPMEVCSINPDFAPEDAERVARLIAAVPGRLRVQVRGLVTEHTDTDGRAHFRQALDGEVPERWGVYVPGGGVPWVWVADHLTRAGADRAAAAIRGEL